LWDFPEGTLDIGSISISYFQILIITGSVLMMAGLYVFVKKSKTGKAMRAVAEDKDTAALMGVNVDRIIATTFATGSSLAAVAGVMVGQPERRWQRRRSLEAQPRKEYTHILGFLGQRPGIFLFRQTLEKQPVLPQT
jgi:branched-chain amino acid transport system permease protein